MNVIYFVLWAFTEGVLWPFIKIFQGIGWLIDGYADYAMSKKYPWWRDKYPKGWRNR